MRNLILRSATISSELFIVLFGIWTLASHVAVVFQLPFCWLGYVFILLLAGGAFTLVKTGFFMAWNYRTNEISSQEKPNKIIETGFILLVIAMLLIALFAHNHNFDDAHYLRTAVDMVDHPVKPVLLMDALGLFDNAPLFIPVYKVQSIETFCAGISALMGLPVIYVFHFLLPVIGLFLSVMAHLLLFRVLIPRHATLATIISFVIIYAVSLRAMGNFTFIRMHQGKGFLLGAILPLIIAYGLKAGEEQKNRNWIILALAQICAIGMNATALWLTPIVANLAVIAGTLNKNPKLLIRNTTYGIVTSIYLVLFGMFVIINFHMPPFYVTRETDAIALIGISITRVFGDSIAMYLTLFVIFFTWIFAPNRLVRILCLLFPGVLLVFFYNPLLAEYMAQYVVSEQIYWRTAWLIPLQTFFGIIGISIFVKHKPRWLVIPKIAFVIGMFTVFLIASPTKTRLFAKESRVEIKSPALKVTKEYYVARQINEILDQEDVLISPNIISMWISTMHHHPATLVYRVKFTTGVLYQYLNILEKNGEKEMEKYIQWTEWYQSKDYTYPSITPLAKRIRKLQAETGVNSLQILLDYEFKLTLKEYINGDTSPANPQEYLTEGLEHYRVTAVCLPVSSTWKDEVTEVLVKVGFDSIATMGDFELWRREL